MGVNNSTENATPLKSTKSINWTSSVQIKIKSKSQVEFVPRITKESEFLGVVKFKDIALSVETVIFDLRYL